MNARRIAAAAIVLGLVPATAVSARAQGAAALPDGCFEATMPAWFAQQSSASDEPVRIRGLAKADRFPGGVGVHLHTTVPGSESVWAVRFMPDGLTRGRGHGPLEGPVLLRSNEWHNLLPVPLAAATVRLDDSAKPGTLAGEADLVIDHDGRSGRVALRFRGVPASAGTDQLSDCLAPDDPRLEVPPPDAADAGDFSGSLAPGTAADGSLAQQASFSGLATIRRRGGARVQGILLCDASRDLTVRVWSGDYSAASPGARASVTVKDGARTMFFAEVPVVPRSEASEEGRYAWFEEESGGVTGTLRVAGDAMLVYRTAEGGVRTETHPAVFDATFRAVSFEDRVTALAAPRDYRALPPAERFEIDKQATCGAGVGGP